MNAILYGLTAYAAGLLYFFLFSHNTIQVNQKAICKGGN